MTTSFFFSLFSRSGLRFLVFFFFGMPKKPAVSDGGTVDERGESGDEPGDLGAVLDALGAIQKQLQKLTTEGLNQQAAFALLEQRLDDVEVGSRSEPGDDAELPAGGPTCIRCHVRPQAVDAVTGQRHPWCSRSCRDSAGDDGTRDDDDVSQTLTARPDRRSDPDATRPPSALGLLSRAYGFRHRYGEGSSGATFNINNTTLSSHVAGLSAADAMQFKDLLALFVRWEGLIALIQESLQADQVQQLSWLWDVFADFDQHFKSHVDAFVIAAAQEGIGNRLLAFKAFQAETADHSLYNTERARELSLKKQTKLFEDNGRKLTGTKKDDDDAPTARRTHRGTRSGQNQRSGAAGGAGQPTSQRQNSQQQQQPSRQQRSSSRDSRGRQGQGRGGGAAGGGAARGGRGGGSQGGAGGGNAPAPPQ